VLSPGDRRSFLLALWNPILPAARWDSWWEKPLGSAQVYLDVSGSMNAEMPLIIGLLNRLRRAIRMPFWAFSEVVAPARIEGGMLRAETTGGTSLACVLEHIARTRPECAVIVTDGYVETLPRKLVLSTRPARIHTLLTRDGSAEELQRAGLSYTQLPQVPS
jgi:predicted metal-dependent peptidase